MLPVDQIVFKENLGDCFRACVASIFEFPIEDMPNFWENTQDCSEFWDLNNEWLSVNKGCRCISFVFNDDERHFIDGLLCVAQGKTKRGNEDHAVVWQDQMIHDPHPTKAGLSERPDTFTLFIPIDPGKQVTKLRV